MILKHSKVSLSTPREIKIKENKLNNARLKAQTESVFFKVKILNMKKEQQTVGNKEKPKNVFASLFCSFYIQKLAAVKTPEKLFVSPIELENEIKRNKNII